MNPVGRRTPVAHFWLNHMAEFPLTTSCEISLASYVLTSPFQEEGPIHRSPWILGGIHKGAFLLRSLQFMAFMALLNVAAGLAAEPLEGLIIPYRQVEVGAPVSSFIMEMKVKEGDLVKTGQPLAQLYGKLDELEMKRTKAILERREYEAKGVKNLFDSKILPEAKALEARIELDLARLNYETAAEQVRLRSIPAPIDGLVVERYREAGEAVQAYQRVLCIVDFSKVFILCSMKPDGLARVTVGQKLPVSFPQLEAGPTLQAEVAFVDPRADASGLLRLKLLLDNPDGRIRGGLKALVGEPESGKVRPQPSPVSNP